MDNCANTQLAQLLACTWSDDEIEEFLRGANIINTITEHGFRKAATEAFMERGYRLATVSRDIPPFDFIHKLSCYMLGDQSRLGRREAKKLARSVMKEIGVQPKPDECMAELSGRRLVVTVGLPQWAWPKLQVAGEVPGGEGGADF